MSSDALFGRLFFIFVCAAAVIWHAHRTPLNNWDIIGYVAATHSNAGLTGAELHSATYNEVRAVTSPNTFAVLTQLQGYRHDVFVDPAALEQQLPFYKVRVAYVWLLGALSDVAGGAARASHVVSAVSAGLLTVLLGALLSWGRCAIPGGLFYLCFPVAALSAGVLGLGRLSTPDALASVAAFSVLALLNRAPTPALILLAVIPLFRTDFIILTALVFIFLILERERSRLKFALIFLSAAVFTAVMVLPEPYGYLTVFNFTLVPGAITPYPEALQVSTDPAVYLQVYINRTIAFLGTPTPLLLLAASIAAFAHRRMVGELGPAAKTTLIAVAFILAHFALFPLGAIRHYAFALLIAEAFLLNVLASQAAKGGQVQTAGAPQ